MVNHMTNLKLINVYLEGFRACHYAKQATPSCPYGKDGDKAQYWLKGFEYAHGLEKALSGKKSENLSHSH